MALRAVTASRWGLLALALAVVAFLVVLLAPLGTVAVESSITGRRTERVSLVDEEGWGVAGVVAIPVAFAAVGAVGVRTRGRRWTTGLSAVLLVLWVLAGVASVGLFWLPAAGAMATAAVLVRRR